MPMEIANRPAAWGEIPQRLVSAPRTMRASRSSAGDRSAKASRKASNMQCSHR